MSQNKMDKDFRSFDRSAYFLMVKGATVGSVFLLALVGIITPGLVDATGIQLTNVVIDLVNGTAAAAGAIIGALIARKS